MRRDIRGEKCAKKGMGRAGDGGGGGKVGRWGSGGDDTGEKKPRHRLSKESLESQKRYGYDRHM